MTGPTHRPMPQRTHADELLLLVCALYCPAVQFTQVRLPNEEPNVPAGHGLHTPAQQSRVTPGRYLPSATVTALPPSLDIRRQFDWDFPISHKTENQTFSTSKSPRRTQWTRG